MAFVKIVMISFVGLLIGAATLFGIVSGPVGLVASPVLMIFGWFYLLPILLCVGVLWFAYQPERGAPMRWLLVAAGGVGGSLLMTLIGVRGPEACWILGYAVAGGLAGGACAAMVVWLKPPDNRGS